jgi:micrococcal nuclease
MKRLVFAILLLTLLPACDTLLVPVTQPGDSAPPPSNIEGETATVIRVIDGDTIDVMLNGVEERVRYVGINTPERDEVCYAEATAANAGFVDGQTVIMIPDVSNRDRYGRLLRYIYVGDTFVNQELIVRGYAEAVLYEPDDRFHATFVSLEREAARASRGCHPTGIFDDNNTER